jgi:hypothetical protein
VGLLCLAKTLIGKIYIQNEQKIETETMDTIYTQTLDSLTIMLQHTKEDGFYLWKTTLSKNKTNKKITLLVDKQTIPQNSVFGNSINETFTQLYNIIGAYVDKQIIYVVYEKWGTILLYCFEFTAPDQFSIQEKELTGHFVTPAYGFLTSNAIFKKISTSLYLLVNVGQSFNTQKTTQLYLINDIQRIYELSTYSSVCMVATYTLSNDAMQWLKTIKDDDIMSEDTLARYDFIKQFKDRSYYFKEISSDENKMYEELYDLQTNDLSLYKFTTFPANETINLILNEILVFCNIDNNVKYLDALIDEQNSIFYFFYLNSDKQIQIVIYEENNSLWKISRKILKE